jgi:hypothetical protein
MILKHTAIWLETVTEAIEQALNGLLDIVV